MTTNIYRHKLTFYDVHHTEISTVQEKGQWNQSFNTAKLNAFNRKRLTNSPIDMILYFTESTGKDKGR